MNNLIIYTHPNPNSFTNAIVKEVQSILSAKGEKVEIIDLYADGFNPTLKLSDFKTLEQGKMPNDVIEYQKKIIASKRIIAVYPIWWMQMPGVFKGFFDRVFLFGFAYKFDDKNYPIGLLNDKKAVIISPMGLFEKDAKQLDLLKSFQLTQANLTFGFCGMQIENHIFFHAVPYVSDEIRKGYLKSLRNYF